ncbi:MAG: FIST C-terminal domain-containing protein [Treponema sp.]|jgi:hypothetical protein|nr:FIST C-terminal domain-containing protein [Treponema sp.]
MIKMMVAHTAESNDAEYAFQEIMGQLGIPTGPAGKGSPLEGGKTLLRNSAGFLFCNLEFIQSGLVKELCARLPFNVVGCVSQGFAVRDAGGDFMLTLTVLSSDDVEFSFGLSAPLVAGNEAVMEDLYRDLLKGGNPIAKPAMMLIFPPSLAHVTGNTIVRTLDRVSGGVPMFGSIPADFTVKMRSPMTIFNGEYYADRMSVVLLRGNISPRFFACSLPKEVNFDQDVTITEVNGNRIISIDNMPAAAFLEKIGLITQGAIDIIYAFPIMVDYHDGSEPRLFAISKIDTDGALISEQDIPVGGTIKIGTIEGELIIKSTRYSIEQIKEMPGKSGVLLISCISRILTLQDSMEEITLIQQQMQDLPVPFLYFYSGGEICPLYKPGQDKPVNAFHQFTFVACII